MVWKRSHKKESIVSEHLYGNCYNCACANNIEIYFYKLIINFSGKIIQKDQRNITKLKKKSQLIERDDEQFMENPHHSAAVRKQFEFSSLYRQHFSEFWRFSNNV